MSAFLLYTIVEQSSLRLLTSSRAASPSFALEVLQLPTPGSGFEAPGAVLLLECLSDPSLYLWVIGGGVLPGCVFETVISSITTEFANTVLIGRNQKVKNDCRDKDRANNRQRVFRQDNHLLTLKAYAT